MLKADRKIHMENLVSTNMTCKEQWEGLKLLREGYKPKRYARKDGHGKSVLLQQRAEATADYLEHSHWAADDDNGTQDEADQVTKNLQERAQRHANLKYNEEKVDLKELKKVLQKLKRNKAPGPDRISTDFLKDLDDENLKTYLELINQWWAQGQIPHEMLRAKVASLYKKGDPSLQDNYRPISLLNIFYKVIAAILKNRLEETVEGQLMETQFGFRKKKNTEQALFIARRIQEFAERAGLPGTMVLLDWEKAFDKVNHDKLLQAIQSYNVPEKLMKLLKSLYEAPEFYVEIEGITSQYKTQSTGIRQGCPLSPYLFIMVMNCVFEMVQPMAREICKVCFEDDHGNPEPFEYAQGIGINFSELLYADDTLLFAADGHSLDALLWAVERASGAFGLKLNRSKCHQIAVNRCTQVLFQDGTPVPRATTAEYLGGLLNTKADPVIEVNRRIGAAGAVWRTLQEFWRKGKPSRRKRISFYDALIVSKLTYGIHTLPLTDAHLTKLDAFVYKGLRQIMSYSTTFVDRNNTNDKLMQLVNHELGRNQSQIKLFQKVSDRIKQKSIALLGQIIRMPNESPRKQVTLIDSTLNIPIKNRVGKPRVHWAIVNMGRAWRLPELQTTATFSGEPFDYKNKKHVQYMITVSKDLVILR